MEKRSGDMVFLSFALAALAGLCFFLAPQGLSTNLEGAQYVQMKNFALNGSLAIDSPALGLGFEAKDIAGPRGFFESRDDRLYAVPPPLFPFIASLFHPLFGERAVDFTPILFVFLSALVLGATLDRVMQRGVLYYLLVAAFLGGSPVLLLAFEFSGQSLALLLIAAGIFLLVRHFTAQSRNPGNLAVSSFLAVAAVLASLEFLFAAVSFLISAGAVFTIQKRWRELAALAAGAVLALAGLVAHDALFHGGFPGPYLKIMLPFYGISVTRCALFSGALALSLFLFAASRRKGAGQVVRAVLTVLPVLLLLAAVLLSAARITVSHLMAVFPAVLFVFYGLPEQMDRLMRGEGSLESILACTVILGVLFGAVIRRPDAGLVLEVWLPLVPFVVLLLGADHRRIFDTGGMYVVLLFFTGVALLNNAQDARSDLWRYKDYNARRIEFLKQNTSAGDAIVFYEPGSMEHAGPLFFERVFLLAMRPDDPARFARQLGERGIEKAYAWTVNSLGVKGSDPYDEKRAAVFPALERKKACCGGSCKAKDVYLIRFDTRAAHSAGSGRGGL